jgi:hypothetical protein
MATKHDWKTIEPLIDRLVSKGFSQEAACKEVGVNWGTYRQYRKRLRDAARPGTLERTDTTEVPESTPEHQGTLEGYQEVIEDIQQSVPEPPHISTPEHQSVLQQPDSPEVVHPRTPEETDSSEAHQGTLEGHQEVMEDVHQSVPEAPHTGAEEVSHGTPEPLSTPVVHPELSSDDSILAHSGVPGRQAYEISTPMVHPGTPNEEDWELWTAVKGRWPEIEEMLAERQALLSTPRGTPGHTQKKTYMIDVRHIQLINQYAQDHRLDQKDVLYQALEEFFQRRGYAEEA